MQTNLGPQSDLWVMLQAIDFILSHWPGQTRDFPAVRPPASNILLCAPMSSPVKSHSYQCLFRGGCGAQRSAGQAAGAGTGLSLPLLLASGSGAAREAGEWRAEAVMGAALTLLILPGWGAWVAQ